MNATPTLAPRPAFAAARPVWLLAALVAAAILLGGTSRYDSPRLILLLPLGCVFAAVGSAMVEWRTVPRVPLVFVIGVFVLLVVQLLPLPFAVWSALPGREPVAAMATAMGLEQAYPLSLAPYRTLNALAGTPLLLAAVTIAAAQGEAAPRRVLAAVALLALTSASFGLLQIALPTEIFYLYEATNIGSPVGLFANANHAALCNVLGILALAALMSGDRKGGAIRWLAPTGIAALTLINLVNGSRSGFIATAIAITAAALAQYLGARAPEQAGQLRRESRKLIVLALGGMALLWLAGSLAILSGKVPAMDQLLAENPLDDMRFALMPTLLAMVRTYWPVGAGIGAFEDTFYIHEPTELVGPLYVNMAHNDFVQVAIEGGLPWIVLYGLAIGGFLLALMRLRRAGQLPAPAMILIAATAAVLIMTSYVEYAMRDPIFEVLAIMAFTATCLAAGTARRAKPRTEQPAPETGKAGR